MLNFKFIRRVSVFLVLAFVLFSHNVSLAQERQEEETKPLTNIYIKDVKVEKREGSIGVSAVLENPSAKLEAPPFAYLLMLEEISPLIKPKKWYIAAKPDCHRPRREIRLFFKPSWEKNIIAGFAA